MLLMRLANKAETVMVLVMNEARWQLIRKGEVSRTLTVTVTMTVTVMVGTSGERRSYLLA